MPELYIFDFDGTIGDSRELIVQTMMDTFDSMGIMRPSVEACTKTIGLPLNDCFAVSAILDERQSEKCAEVYREIFNINKKKEAVKPFEGVIETLNRLHTEGKVMAIASSRQHESLDVLIEDFGIADLFSMIVGGDDVKNAKPNAEPVNFILSKLGFNARQALVVGDAPVDVMMGRNAGAKTCAVTYGNGSLGELKDSKPDYLVNEFRKILEIG